MMKIVAAIAMLSLALSGTAWAQQILNQNGNVVDGMGGGDNKSNGYIYDGPLGPNGSGLYYVPTGQRTNKVPNNLICPQHEDTLPCLQLEHHERLGNYQP